MARRYSGSILITLALCALGCVVSVVPADGAARPDRLLIRGPTVVTMDARHHVIRDGRVLVEGTRIAAVWRAHHRPPGIRTRGIEAINRGRRSLLFPGLINLHDHPSSDVVPSWPTPASHALPDAGKAGTDAYANRYQWNTTSPDELRRLVSSPREALGGLDLDGEVVKYAEVAALLGGETAIQGAGPNPESDGVLARNIDNDVFDERIARPWVPAIETLTGARLEQLRSEMSAGLIDAWMVHLAEGVRDAHRRPGDGVSSRTEFRTLAEKGLLTDATVIIHGTALQRPDFAAMRAAGPMGGAAGDGRGAKLVWSPRSNLVLYGETTNVYEALAEGVLVSLGTDWTPSGSHTMLDELKVADRALRDPRVLGDARGLVDRVAVAGADDAARARAERTLDRTLVDMVTRNPALALRWDDRVGSIERGKRADLLLVRRPPGSSNPDVPPSVYRGLIDARDRNVQLVTVDGLPLAGSVPLFARLKGSDFEVITSSTGAYNKAVDVTAPVGSGVPEGDETFAALSRELGLGLRALGGDDPPPGGGPAGPANTYSYLKSHFADGALAGLNDASFHALLTGLYGTDAEGRLNIEAIDLIPVLGPDRLGGAILDGDLDPATGLLADPAPPFALYPANLNHVGARGNPFAGLR